MFLIQVLEKADVVNGAGQHADAGDELPNRLLGGPIEVGRFLRLLLK
jgi:hypothetical protein